MLFFTSFAPVFAILSSDCFMYVLSFAAAFSGFSAFSKKWTAFCIIGSVGRVLRICSIDILSCCKRKAWTPARAIF